MSEHKNVKFVGGPLDGQVRHIASHLTRYEHDQPPPPEDIHAGEAPIGFFPPFHQYIYHEDPPGSGVFVYKH